jgi:type II secretion system protein D
VKTVSPAIIHPLKQRRLLWLGAAALGLFLCSCTPKNETAEPPPRTAATNASPSASGDETASAATPNVPAPASAPLPPTTATNTAAVAPPPATGGRIQETPKTAGVPTNRAPASAGVSAPGSNPAGTGHSQDVPVPSDEEIQLSFNGANIEAIVKWLAKTTGKSVVKHPQVNCRLTIVSSRKLPAREAVDLVYSALSLEGFATVETATSIVIVPEGKEPKTSPEFMTETVTNLPEGRQRLVKIFSVTNVPATEIKERLLGIVSEGSNVEADDRGNRLIVTGYTDNVRLLGELIQRLDVGSATDTEIKIFTLKYLEANDLAGLLNLVLNNKPGTPSSSRPSAPSSSSSSSRRIVSNGRVISISGPNSSPPSGSHPGPGAGAPAPSDLGGELAIRLWPDINSNRLIVSAPKARLGEIEELIKVLDVEKPADVSLRIIPLQHVDAQNLVQDIAPLYQKMSGQSLKETIEIAANERANALIILSSESNYRAFQAMVAQLDTPDAQEKVLRSFALKNADAEDVAEQLQQLNQEGTGMARLVYYYPMPSSSGRSSTKLNVVADRRRNTVIVQGPPASIEGVAEIIKALDEPIEDNSLAPRIYPLKYVSAVDIEDVLNELFLKRQDDGNVLRSYILGMPSTPKRDSDAGRLYGKVRITSEPNSNAIIVTSNSPENLEAVESILKQLDVPSQAGENTLRVPLKFAQAIPTANNLNILFARGGSPPLRQQGQPLQPNDPRNLQPNAGAVQGGFQLEQDRKEEQYYPWLGGQPETFRTADGRTNTRTASDLVGRVRVVADERSNSLLITASVHHFPEVLNLVNELDAPTAQVLIEAKIVEVSSDFRDRLGVRFSPDGSQVFDAEDFDNSLMPSASAEYLKVFAGSPAAGALQSGILNANMNLDLLIQFLRKTTDATVLAQPQINVSDNELGKLFVGAQVPFIFNSINTDVGGRNDSFQYKDVGIILEVTPHINNAEDVALKIHAESSNIRSGETLFGGAIVDTRNFHTDLLVKSGETIVLGGIIQQEEADTIRKVPLLGDIPLLGYLFKKRDKITRNVELMVFLKPRITRSPEQAVQLMREVRDNMPRLNEWERKQEGEMNRRPKAPGENKKKD